MNCKSSNFYILQIVSSMHIQYTYLHIITVLQGTVQPNLCFEKLKGQLNISKQNLRQNLEMRVTIYHVI